MCEVLRRLRQAIGRVLARLVGEDPAQWCVFSAREAERPAVADLIAQAQVAAERRVLM